MTYGRRALFRVGTPPSGRTASSNAPNSTRSCAPGERRTSSSWGCHSTERSRSRHCTPPSLATARAPPHPDTDLNPNEHTFAPRPTAAPPQTSSPLTTPLAPLRRRHAHSYVVADACRARTERGWADAADHLRQAGVSVVQAAEVRARLELWNRNTAVCVSGLRSAVSKAPPSLYVRWAHSSRQPSRASGRRPKPSRGKCDAPSASPKGSMSRRAPSHTHSIPPRRHPRAAPMASPPLFPPDAVLLSPIALGAAQAAGGGHTFIPAGESSGESSEERRRGAGLWRPVVAAAVAAVAVAAAWMLRGRRSVTVA